MKKALTLQDIKPFPMGKDGLKFKSLITHEDETIDYIDFKYGHVGTHNELLPYSEDNAMCHKVSEIKPYLRSLDQLKIITTIDGKAGPYSVHLADYLKSEGLNDYYIRYLNEGLKHGSMPFRMTPKIIIEWLSSHFFNVNDLDAPLFIELKEETK